MVFFNFLGWESAKKRKKTKLKKWWCTPWVFRGEKDTKCLLWGGWFIRKDR